MNLLLLSNLLCEIKNAPPLPNDIKFAKKVKNAEKVKFKVKISH